MHSTTTADNTLQLATDDKRTPLYQKILVVIGMMTLMAGTLTGVMTYMNTGFNESFYLQWLQAFLTAAFVMAPVGFTTMSLLTIGIKRLLPNASETKRNLVIGLLMAVIMESLMAFTTTATTLGFADSALFFTGWLSGFLAALPVGLVLMVVVSATIKPKVERFLKS